jgi:hypothetical protein
MTSIRHILNALASVAAVFVLLALVFGPRSWALAFGRWCQR